MEQPFRDESDVPDAIQTAALPQQVYREFLNRFDIDQDNQFEYQYFNEDQQQESVYMFGTGRVGGLNGVSEVSAIQERQMVLAGNARQAVAQLRLLHGRALYTARADQWRMCSKFPEIAPFLIRSGLHVLDSDEAVMALQMLRPAFRKLTVDTWPGCWEYLCLSVTQLERDMQRGTSNLSEKLINVLLNLHNKARAFVKSEGIKQDARNLSPLQQECWTLAQIMQTEQDSTYVCTELEAHAAQFVLCGAGSTNHASLGTQWIRDMQSLAQDLMKLSFFSRAFDPFFLGTLVPYIQTTVLGVYDNSSHPFIQVLIHNHYLLPLQCSLPAHLTVSDVLSTLTEACAHPTCWDKHHSVTLQQCLHVNPDLVLSSLSFFMTSSSLMQRLRLATQLVRFSAFSELVSAVFHQTCQQYTMMTLAVYSLPIDTSTPMFVQYSEFLLLFLTICRTQQQLDQSQTFPSPLLSHPYYFEWTQCQHEITMLTGGVITITHENPASAWPALDLLTYHIHTLSSVEQALLLCKAMSRCVYDLQQLGSCMLCICHQQKMHIRSNNQVLTLQSILALEGYVLLYLNQRKELERALSDLIVDADAVNSVFAQIKGSDHFVSMSLSFLHLSTDDVQFLLLCFCNQETFSAVRTLVLSQLQIRFDGELVARDGDTHKACVLFALDQLDLCFRSALLKALDLGGGDKNAVLGFLISSCLQETNTSLAMSRRLALYDERHVHAQVYESTCDTIVEVEERLLPAAERASATGAHCSGLSTTPCVQVNLSYAECGFLRKVLGVSGSITSQPRQSATVVETNLEIFCQNPLFWMSSVPCPDSSELRLLFELQKQHISVGTKGEVKVKKNTKNRKSAVVSIAAPTKEEENIVMLGGIAVKKENIVVSNNTVNNASNVVHANDNHNILPSISSLHMPSNQNNLPPPSQDPLFLSMPSLAPSAIPTILPSVPTVMTSVEQLLEQQKEILHTLLPMALPIASISCQPPATSPFEPLVFKSRDGAKIGKILSKRRHVDEEVGMYMLFCDWILTSALCSSVHGCRYIAEYTNYVHGLQLQAEEDSGGSAQALKSSSPLEVMVQYILLKRAGALDQPTLTALGQAVAGHNLILSSPISESAQSTILLSHSKKHPQPAYFYGQLAVLRSMFATQPALCSTKLPRTEIHKFIKSNLHKLWFDAPISFQASSNLILFLLDHELL